MQVESVFFSRTRTTAHMKVTPLRTGIVSLIAVLSAAATALPADDPPAGDLGEARRAVLKTYDRNGDGRLSDREREVMRKQHFEQRRRAMAPAAKAIPLPSRSRRNMTKTAMTS
jgi:hypothetical protein